MRTAELVEKAFAEFQQWIIDDRKIAIRIAELLADTQRTPFSGLESRSRSSINIAASGAGGQLMSIG
jgi:Txe/YoeB family toxin of Txe-Axe toxin-antitoxin module